MLRKVASMCTTGLLFASGRSAVDTQRIRIRQLLPLQVDGAAAKQRRHCKPSTPPAARGGRCFSGWMDTCSGLSPSRVPFSADAACSRRQKLC